MIHKLPFSPVGSTVCIGNQKYFVEESIGCDGCAFSDGALFFAKRALKFDDILGPCAEHFRKDKLSVIFKAI